jgi:hypothetical protein
VSLEAASLTAIVAIALPGVSSKPGGVGRGCRGERYWAGWSADDSVGQSGRLSRNRRCSADPDTPSRVKEFARHGVDVALITAATPSAEPIELTASICRDRGRVVVVGTVDLGVSRQPMYMKELSLVRSRSYGPGRYDPQYEEEGVDYPIGYVRWTEKRNMEAFLELLASG